MKKILLAPDKFKDSLTAIEVISSMKDGIHCILPHAHIYDICLSDGGDGFLDALKNNNSEFCIKSFKTVNAINHPIISYMGLDQSTNSAYIELAQASGIAQLQKNERNALFTSTFGTGLLIKKVMDLGYKTLYVGLGGSATNDGGCGIAAALGYKFYNSDRQKFIPTAINLNEIRDIGIPDHLDQTIKIIAINDVTNPLLGKEGATYVYGPQKGLKEEDLEMVESGMKNLEGVVRKKLDKNYAPISGAGAAGGTAYGLKVFLDAEYMSGIDFFIRNNNKLNTINLANLDLIITAEGRIDDQTKYGKLISGISNLGNTYGIPVAAFCGKNDLKKFTKEELQLADIIEISDNNMPLDYNLKNASKHLSKKIENYIKNWISHNTA